MYWTTGSGRIELTITKRQAQACSHAGQCDADVLALSKEPRIAGQLVRLNGKLVRDELREYGAWDEAELADHEQNRLRLLWIAANDISEGNC